MEIKIDKQVLQKCKLMLATPAYGGVLHGAHMQSVIKLQNILTQLGVPFMVNHLYNESLIQRARSYMTDAFMRSDCTHMLFVDADVQFKAEDVVCLLALQSQKDSPYDVIGAAYPKKTISYEKVLAAAKSGVADKDPNLLANYVGDFVMNPVGGQATIPINEPVQVAELGTGFMMIRRETWQKWEKAHQDRLYLPDHVRTKDFDGSREIYLYFDVYVDKQTKRLLSEDYAFCHEVRDIGMQVWMCPWMELVHHGSMAFGGSLAALGSVGAAATADPAKLGSKQ